MSDLKFKIDLLSAIIVLSWLGAEAKPAKPGLLSMTQPDGSTIEVRLVGDENFHCYYTEDGYPLVETAAGFFYARPTADADSVVSTGVKAVSASRRSAQARDLLATIDAGKAGHAFGRMAARRTRRTAARSASPSRAAGYGDGFKKGPGLFPGTAFPSIGEQKAVVILVEYADVKFELSDPHDYFSRMLNEEDFADYGGTGSARQYFEECSNGLFRPQFDVLGPVTLSQRMAYYGGNYSGTSANPGMMVVEACQQLDATVDFSQYDRDGDGFIDNVFLFYAGRGEATGGGADTVWPHSWGITTAYPTKDYIFDGVQLDRYACSNEWEGSRPDGVGTFVHEFSHVMGLPDLYTTAYTSAFTPGAWSALDYGPYNNNGTTPPLYGAFERYALGWMEPAVISGALNATLPPIGSNIAGLVKTDSEYEFFLVENRQQTSWDTYIPGHGMLVWHIDYNLAQWRDNCVNNSTSHQHVDIEEADNLPTPSTRDGDPFPGYDNITSFTDDTSPSMRAWSGKALNLPFTEIAESDEGVVTFKVCGGAAPIGSTTATGATDVTDESFVANWENASDGSGYLLSVYTRRDGKAEYLPGWQLRPVGNVTSCEVGGLDADAAYYYTVCNARGLEMSAPSNEIEVFTGAPTIGRLRVESTGAVGIDDHSFVATWNPLPDAIDYEINVYTKIYDAEIVDVCDFSAGVKPLPKGWTSSSSSSFANASYSGAAIPALRLSAADHITASFGDDVRSVSFWQRGSSTSAGDYIRVYAVGTSERTLVASFEVVTDKGGRVCSADAFPEGTSAVRIEFDRKGTKGSLSIDDVVVGHGYAYAPVPVEGHSGRMTGSTDTSALIDNLQSGTEYYYTVRGYDGIRFSRPSIETKAATESVSGIFSAESASVAVAAVGRCITVEAPGADIAVYDVTGRRIASGSGSLSATLPSAGVYIVKAASETFKQIVK